jgi:phage gp36-like protein
MITTADYGKRIKTEVLNAITNNDITIREDAEATAIEEAKSYLSSRFDTRLAFLEYENFDPMLTYPDYARTRLGNFIQELTPSSISGYPTVWKIIYTKSPLITTYIIDIVLYRICRINPRQQPELYSDRYDQAIAWFKSCAIGDTNPMIPAAQLTQQDNLESAVKYGNKSKFRTNDSRYF